MHRFHISLSINIDIAELLIKFKCNKKAKPRQDKFAKQSRSVRSLQFFQFILISFNLLKNLYVLYGIQNELFYVLVN